MTRTPIYRALAILAIILGVWRGLTCQKNTVRFHNNHSPIGAE